VQLHAAVFVGEVHAHLCAFGEHAGAEDALGVALDSTSEQHRHHAWSAETNIVGDQCFEEGASTPRGIEDQRTRDLNLAHAELPPVASRAVDTCEWTGDPRDPVVEEGLQFGRAESVAEDLQSTSIFTRSEAVGQFGERETSGLCLTL